MPKLPNNPKGRFIVRVLAGGYLLYLAWSLRGEFRRLSALTLAPVFFIVVGLLFIATGLLAISRLEADQEDAPEEVAEAEDEEEENEETGEDEEPRSDEVEEE